MQLKIIAAFCCVLLGVVPTNTHEGTGIISTPVGSGTHLFIKAFPGVPNIQSNLYEVYAEPYNRDISSIFAVAVVKSKDEGGVEGVITFAQPHPPGSPVLIKANLTGVPAGKHGLHIHQSGDVEREGCDKLGGHFNPYRSHHGGIADPVRHVGDLGNIEANEDGTAEIELLDNLVTLMGGHGNIVGRAIAITEGKDDLGRGGTANSLTDGDSGKALACGIIAYVR